MDKRYSKIFSPTALVSFTDCITPFGLCWCLPCRSMEVVWSFFVVIFLWKRLFSLVPGLLVDRVPTKTIYSWDKPLRINGRMPIWWLSNRKPCLPKKIANYQITNSFSYSSSCCLMVIGVMKRMLNIYSFLVSFEGKILLLIWNILKCEFGKQFFEISVFSIQL